MGRKGKTEEKSCKREEEMGRKLYCVVLWGGVQR